MQYYFRVKITQSYFNLILKRHYLFEKQPKIAVAVSGGPDSMALLFLLNIWIKKKRGSLVALIVDHKIRKESGKEAKTISDYLKEHKIRSKILNINKKNVLKKTMSEARQNRFLQMVKYCKKYKFLHLFVGHHNNDNIETFLLRKIAGSNFEGLRSMQHKAIINDIQILRPFLNFNKLAIIRFNKSKNIKYIEDPSNDNLHYTRVAVRKFLLQETIYIKNVEKDFNLIQKYYPYYKQMLFQIFHRINTHTFTNKIVVNYKKFMMIDKEIKIKIIEIIYKFLMPKRNALRYAKVIKALDLIGKKSSITVNLAGMHINKSKIMISFML